MPKIDNGYVRSPSNGHRGIKQVNNLFDNKGTRYGNLLTKDKNNTIDLLGEKKTESDFMKNKNYADIRLKLGQKKIPDKYSKSINPMKANDDAESIPSDIEDD